jgi:hypothetical protein
MSLDYPDGPSPAEWGGPFLIDPVFIGGGAVWLILLAVAALALWNNRRQRDEERRARDKAPEHIYDAVRKALDQALLKTGAGTLDGGRAVAEALELHLGPLLSFSGGCSKPLNALKKALQGDGPARVPPRGNHERPSGGVKTQPALVVSSGARDKVVISSADIVTRDDGQDAHPPEAAHAHPAEPQPMSTREQIIAVREALEQLSDHWRKEAVLGDLRKIQALLMITPPAVQDPPRR